MKKIILCAAATLLGSLSFAGGGGSDSGRAANTNQNNGNNPGNPKAAGYTKPLAGSSVPVVSTFGGGGADSGRAVNSTQNNGNNPGNPRAAGYTNNSYVPASDRNRDTNFDSNYTTSPSSGTYTNTALPIGTGTPSTVSGVVKAMRLVAQSAVTAAENFYGSVSPNVRAMVAGQKAMEASIRGTTNLDSFAAKRAMERAMYFGRIKHLVDVEGISVKRNYEGITLGPIEERLKSGHGYDWKNLSEDEKKFFRTMDISFINFGDFIALPGEITPSNGATTYGPGYNKLTPVQKLGLRDGFTFVSLSEAIFREGTDATDTLAKMAGLDHSVSGFSHTVGYHTISVARGNREDTTDTVVHELDHTGGKLVYSFAWDDSGRDNFPARQTHEKKDLAILEMGAYGYGEGNIKKYFPNVDVNTPQVDYLNSITEQLAHSATKGDSKFYQDQLVDAVKSAYDFRAPTPKDDDIRKVADVLLNSPTLKIIRDTQNEYADFYLDNNIEF